MDLFKMRHGWNSIFSCVYWQTFPHALLLSSVALPSLCYGLSLCVDVLTVINQSISRGPDCNELVCRGRLTTRLNLGMKSNFACCSLLGYQSTHLVLQAQSPGPAQANPVTDTFENTLKRQQDLGSSKLDFNAFFNKVSCLWHLLIAFARWIFISCHTALDQV